MDEPNFYLLYKMNKAKILKEMEEQNRISRERFYRTGLPICVALVIIGALALAISVG